MSYDIHAGNVSSPQKRVGIVSVGCRFRDDEVDGLKGLHFGINLPHFNNKG